MIFTLARRDLRAKYAGSYLGVAWNLLHPLMMIGLYYFIFAVVFGLRDSEFYRGATYLPWFLAGFTAWMLFADTINGNVNVILNNSSMITKEVFPSEVLPVSTFLGNLISHLVYLVATIVIVSIYISPPGMEFFPKLGFALGILFLFSLGLSWILAAVTVFVRDLSQFVTLLMTVWFYLTPVLIPIDFIENRVGGWAGTLARLNPMYYVVEGYRDAIFGGSILSTTESSVALALALLVFLLGATVFRTLKPSFAEVL
jgi:ABC-type polysaccharide/polyol phosphate export permease